MAFDPEQASLADLGKWTGQAEPGSLNHTRGMAEFTKRQTEWQIKAAAAQIKAAEAEEAAANAARDAASSAARNANYMLWSVIVAAAAALASASSAYFAWKATHQPVPISLTLAPTVSPTQPAQPKP